WVPGGMRNCARPSMVGTSIFAPKAASSTLTGTLISMLSATRWKIGGGPEDEKEIACRASIDACIAFARQSNALTVACAGLDAELDGLGTLHCTVSMAGGTAFLGASRTSPTRAPHIELHPPAHLGHVAGAVALRALHRGAG